MIIAPPLDPSTEEIKATDVRTEGQCIAKFKISRISNEFNVARTYVTRSPSFGLIARLDLEQIRGKPSRMTGRFMCWTDHDTGDVVTALALGHKGQELPEE